MWPKNWRMLISPLSKYKERYTLDWRMCIFIIVGLLVDLGAQPAILSTH